MDNTVYVLVEKVNSREIPVYQKKIERKSITLQIEGEIEIIHNLTTNLISEKKLPKISKEIQKVIDRHPKVISKGE